MKMGARRIVNTACSVSRLVIAASLFLTPLASRSDAVGERSPVVFRPARLCGGLSSDHHPGAGWVPGEILERPVVLREGIGNLHQAVTTSSPEAQEFYDQGLDYLHAFVWIEAARSFHQALRLDPHMAMAYEGLGEDYIALSDDAAARIAVEKAESLADKVTPVERTRINILSAQLDYLDDPNADMQKYFAIRKMIGDALTASPRDPWLWILRGFADEGSPAAHGQDGGIDTIAFYQTALALSPDNSAAHHYLAHTLENLGLSQQALEEATAFERLAPAIPHAHHMRGHELRLLGRTQEAIVEFQKADELENSYYKAEDIPPGLDWHHAHNLDLMALSYESLGQVKSAERRLREAVSEPAHTDIAEFNWRELPDFLLDRGRPDDALKAAEDMIARSSWAMGRFGGHAEAGEAYVALGRIDDAKSELQLTEQEMERVPLTALSVLPQAKVLQAEILLSEGNFAQAEVILKPIEQRILAMSGPDSWMDTLFELQSIAQVARRAGDWDLSEFTAQKMVAHDPSYAGGYFDLGLALQHRGDAAAARTQFQTAEKLWANADTDLPELKQIRDRLGAQP